jgi:hypothetical protein
MARPHRNDHLQRFERQRGFICAGWGFITLLLHSLPAFAAEDAGVQWSRGRLSVQAGSQPLVEVLKSIRAQTGIEIRGDGALAEPVVKGFESLPLADALARLLSNTNHMIVQRGPRQPLLVVVLGGAGSGVGTTPSAPAAAFSRPTAVAPPVAAAAAQQAAQQAALQRAQQAAQTVTPQSLRDTALSSPDTAARIEAVERLAEMAEKGDANSLAVLRQALNDPSDAVRAVAQQAVTVRDKLPVSKPGKSAKSPG